MVQSFICLLYHSPTNSKTAYIQANITHQTPAMDNTTEVVLLFTLPSYFKYEQFTSNGSRPPNNVTVTRADKFLSLTMKVIL